MELGGSSVYKRYKLLTEYVAFWLATTGAAANCPASLIQSDLSRAAYKISTSAFIPLAEWIEHSRETIHIPKSVLKDLDEAIHLRVIHSTALRGQVASTTDDKRHDHFVNILRQLRAVLQRLPTLNSIRAASTNSKLGTTSASFSALDMKEIPDEAEMDDGERQKFLASVGTSDATPALHSHANKPQTIR